MLLYNIRISSYIGGLDIDDGRIDRRIFPYTKIGIPDDPEDNDQDGTYHREHGAAEREFGEIHAVSSEWRVENRES